MQAASPRREGSPSRHRRRRPQLAPPRRGAPRPTSAGKRHRLGRRGKGLQGRLASTGRRSRLRPPRHGAGRHRGSVRCASAGEVWGCPAPPVPLLAGERPASLDGAAGGLLPSSLLFAHRLRSSGGGGLTFSRGLTCRCRFGAIFPRHATFAVDHTVQRC
jgi:hypothetical protein